MRFPSRLTARLAVLLALLPAAARAETAAAGGPAERSAIIAVIQRQLDAFRADRGAEAFSYAAPGVQRRFGTPERFMMAVRTAYPSVYRPRLVRFLDLVTRDGQPVQQVLLIGPDGAAVLAFYGMERQPGGEWRIGGCRLKRLAERAA